MPVLRLVPRRGWEGLINSMIYDPHRVARKIHAEFDAAYQAGAKAWQGPPDAIPNRDFILDQTVKLMPNHPLSITNLVKAVFWACEAKYLNDFST